MSLQSNDVCGKYFNMLIFTVVVSLGTLLVPLAAIIGDLLVNPQTALTVQLILQLTGLILVSVACVFAWRNNNDRTSTGELLTAKVAAHPKNRKRNNKKHE